MQEVKDKLKWHLEDIFECRLEDDPTTINFSS